MVAGAAPDLLADAGVELMNGRERLPPLNYQYLRQAESSHRPAQN